MAQLSKLEPFYLRNVANLKQLDVSRNRLREFPPEIGTVRLMTELKVPHADLLLLFITFQGSVCLHFSVLTL